MAVRAILRWPDPRLRQVCAAVALPVPADVLHLAEDMLETMYAATGRGLAAPQVGVSARLFVMDATWKAGVFAPQVFFNPKVLWLSDQQITGPEGCLSLPGITADVARAAEVRLGWQDRAGAQHKALFSGFAAICVQHECDHLEGIVTLDHMTPPARALAEAALQ